MTQATVPPETPARPPRVLRSRSDRVLGGVAGGLARHFGVDPILVRIGFVVAAFFGGIGVLAYIVGWIAIPDEPPGASGEANSRSSTRPDPRQLVGLALLGVGLLVVFGRLGLGADGDVVWPVGLIVIGGSVLWLRARDRRAAEDDTATVVEPEAPARPSTPWPTAPPTPASLPPDSPGWSPPPGVKWPTPGIATPPARERRPRSFLGPLTIGAALIVAGVLWIVDLAGIADVDPALGLALVLGTIGAGLIVGAWWGHGRAALVPVALVLTCFLTILTVADIPLGAGIGERTYRPVSLTALDDEYRLGVGQLVVDLRTVDLDSETAEVRAHLGIGQLQVLVPPDARIVARGEVGAGDLELLGDTDGSGEGLNVDRSTERDGREGAGTLVLDAEVGFGQLYVGTTPDEERG